MERKIIHIDMDAYFASVEQRDYPIFKGKPLMVCHTDDIDSNRGIVTTASYEARSMGIKTGISVMEARKRCPNGVYISGNYNKYLYASKQITDICRRFSDYIEVYSIDEMFLDVSFMSFSKAVAVAKRLQDTIYKELRLTCSIGLGPNKLVAKMSSDLNKPNGLSVITADEWAETFHPMPIKELFGVGSRMQKHFKSIGVSTIGQLAALKTVYLQSKFGLPGLWLHRASMGIDPTPISLSKHTPIKSFGHSSALGNGISDMIILEKVLLALSEGIGYRMRNKKYYSKTITLRLGLNRMFYFTRSITLTRATDSTRTIYNQGLRLLKKEIELINTYPCTLIGLSACNLRPFEDGSQLDFFDSHKDSLACRAMDKAKKRFGDQAIIRGSLLGFRKRYEGVAKVELTKIGRGHSSFCKEWIE